MKTITWNCNMAFRKKWQSMIDLRPDILVIQECEQESKYKPSELIPNYNEFIWMGDNPNKGIGILSFNNYHIELADHYNDAFKYIIPIKVTGIATFNLFAIWAMPHKTKAKSYVGQIWNALQYYESDLENPTILIGDFNSNAIWDKERKNGNHSDVVDLLDQYNITSLYHYFKQEKHGKESEPTLFLLKKQHRPYHIDYCFVTKSMITDQTEIEVGTFDNWIKKSDHMPVVVDQLKI